MVKAGLLILPMFKLLDAHSSGQTVLGNHMQLHGKPEHKAALTYGFCGLSQWSL